MLLPGAQQHLRHRQAHQLGIGQPLRPAGPAPGRRDHVVVDLHVQCGQEGIQVWGHNRPWMPSSLTLINPARRAGLNKESLIQRGFASDRRVSWFRSRVADRRFILRP